MITLCYVNVYLILINYEMGIKLITPGCEIFFDLSISILDRWVPACRL